MGYAIIASRSHILQYSFSTRYTTQGAYLIWYIITKDIGGLPPCQSFNVTGARGKGVGVVENLPICDWVNGKLSLSLCNAMQRAKGSLIQTSTMSKSQDCTMALPDTVARPNTVELPDTYIGT